MKTKPTEYDQFAIESEEQRRQQRLALNWAVHAATTHRRYVQRKRAIGLALKIEWLKECEGIERTLIAMRDAL
jgi:hypothetical protein